MKFPLSRREGIKGRGRRFFTFYEGVRFWEARKLKKEVLHG
jgi:hypothetical protein